MNFLVRLQRACPYMKIHSGFIHSGIGTMKKIDKKHWRKHLTEYPIPCFYKYSQTFPHLSTYPILHKHKQHIQIEYNMHLLNISKNLSTTQNYIRKTLCAVQHFSPSPIQFLPIFIFRHHPFLLLFLPENNKDLRWEQYFNIHKLFLWNISVMAV